MRISAVCVLTGLAVACAMALVALDATWTVAACSDTTVRPNSPCVTEFPVCNERPPCGNMHTLVYRGDFQCDKPNAGTTCMGSYKFQLCRTVCNCVAVGLSCQPGGICQSHMAETKEQVNCH